MAPGCHASSSDSVLGGSRHAGRRWYAEKVTFEHWLAVGAICVSIIVAAVGGLGFVSVQLGSRISELSRHPGARLDTLECDVRELRANILNMPPRV